jgi:hypothetical protein
MTPAEAIREARKRGLWFRPATWRGRGNALREDRGGIKLSGCLYDEVTWWHCSISALECDDWEAVDPEVVREERDSLALRALGIKVVPK